MNSDMQEIYHCSYECWKCNKKSKDNRVLYTYLVCYFRYRLIMLFAYNFDFDFIAKDKWAIWRTYIASSKYSHNTYFHKYEDKNFVSNSENLH